VVWTGALPDDGVEEIGEETARATVYAADVGEVPGVLQVALHELHVALVVELMPDSDRLIWKTTIREGDDRRSADLQHAPDLSQHLHRPGQVIDGDADPNPIELRIPERQVRIRVQILDHVGVEPLIAAQLYLVHAEPDHAAVFDFRRQVADPAAHEVQDRA
jgi:hypothetical protein